MGKTREKGKENKSAEFYRSHFGKGELTACRRCGAYYERFGGEISQVNGKWLCKFCVDPED